MSKNIAIILGEFHKKEVTEMLVEARKVAKENNLKISEEIDDPAAKISYTYQYDKNGNEVMKSDMATSFDSHYVYGKTDAILKSKKTEYDDFEFDIVNYFEFSEITYEDGSTEGSRVFDKEFAKSFNMSVLSYDFIDDLK